MASLSHALEHPGQCSSPLPGSRRRVFKLREAHNDANPDAFLQRFDWNCSSPSFLCLKMAAIIRARQAQVDEAPLFPEVLKSFAEFLAKHGLIDIATGESLQRFCWCCDGPYDIRDFVVKQCFISNVNLVSQLVLRVRLTSLIQIPLPVWMKGNILDVRRAVSKWMKQSGHVKVSLQIQARALHSHLSYRSVR